MRVCVCEVDGKKLLEFLAHRAPVNRFALALLVCGEADDSGDEDADYHDVSCYAKCDVSKRVFMASLYGCFPRTIVG